LTSAALASRTLAIRRIAAGGRASTAAGHLTVSNDGIVPPEGINPASHVVVHEVKVRVVTVLIPVSGVRAPLLVSLVGAQVGNHDRNWGVLNGAVARVYTVTGRGDLEARSTAGATP